MSDDPQKRDEQNGIPWGDVAIVAGGVLVTAAVVAVACTGVGAVAEVGVGAAVVGTEAAVGSTAVVAGTEAAVVGTEVAGVGLIGAESAGVATAGTTIATETATTEVVLEGAEGASQVSQWGKFAEHLNKAREVVGQVHDTVDAITNHPLARSVIDSNEKLSEIVDTKYPEMEALEKLGGKELAQGYHLCRMVHKGWEAFQIKEGGESSKHAMPAEQESESQSQSV